MMRLFTILLTLSTLHTAVIAQKTEIIRDQHGIKGQIKFNGTLSDTLLPKNGPFELQWREIDSNELNTYFTKGQLKNHQPTGQWSWEEASWKQQINVGTSIAPQLLTSGKRAKWIGKFVNGLQEGKWIYTLDSVSQNGQITRKLLRIEQVYKNGIPSGTFKLEDFSTKSPLQVFGQCNNGIAVGIWKYITGKTDDSNFDQERVYTNGLLLSVKTGNGKQTNIRQYQDNQSYHNSSNKETLPYQIGNNLFETDEIRDEMSEWLKSQLTSQFQSGWKLSKFPVNVTFQTPMYKRLQYPFSDKELHLIASIKQSIQSQKEDINRVMVDHMEIHRTRNTTLDTTVTHLELLLNRFSIIEAFMEQSDNPIFLYQTRETKQFKDLVSTLSSTSIGTAQSSDSLVVQLNVIPESDSLTTIFGSLQKIILNHEQQLPSYIHVVEEAHLSVKQESELQNLEEKILEKLSLQRKFYIKEKGLNHEISSRWLENEIPTQLQKYAQTDQYEDAKKIGLQIIKTLDSLQVWQEQTTQIDKADSIFRATYTLLAYNPYTGVNDISMITKKRFLITLTTQIWPHIINTLHAKEQWNEWSIQWSKTWSYYNYFLQFAKMEDKNSKRVEKKVRKEKKVERMLKIIEHHMEDL